MHPCDPRCQHEMFVVLVLRQLLAKAPISSRQVPAGLLLLLLLPLPLPLLQLLPLPLLVLLLLLPLLLLLLLLLQSLVHSFRLRQQPIRLDLL